MKSTSLISKYSIKAFFICFIAIYFSVLTIKAEAESVSSIEKCIEDVCLANPSDVAVSSDGSFIIVVDSGNLDNPNQYLRKINISQKGNTISEELIPLHPLSSEEVPFLNIKLSPNNEKVLVYSEPIENSVQLRVVDLKSKSIKDINAISSASLTIDPVEFFDDEGNIIIAATLSNPSKLITIDLNEDTILNGLELEDKVQSIHISQRSHKALITYEGALAQSVSILDNSGKFTTLDINSSLSFFIDDFLKKVDFDLKGKNAVLSSLDGNHVLHFLDLTGNKLTSKILNSSSEGSTLSTISPDGSTAVCIGSILDPSIGFTVYKINLKRGLSSSSASFTDESIVLDVKISPDQDKIFILALKNNKKVLKILGLKNLNLISELELSSDSSENNLILSPYGNFAVTNNSDEISVNIINELNPGPLVKEINPDAFPANIEIPFTINGFIDLSRFSKDGIKVCFGNACTSDISISQDGMSISGITPKTSLSGLQDLTISANSILERLIKSTKYIEFIRFIKNGFISDNVPPEIKIEAPNDFAFLNSQRVFVSGKADGTGSEIKKVTINGQDAKLTTAGQLTTSSFIGDLKFSSDGNYKVVVNAIDSSNNTAEKNINLTIDTQSPIINANVESLPSGEFKVSGIVSETGSKVSSIIVGSKFITFQANSEGATFETTTNQSPVRIKATDLAGNSSEITIASPLLTDRTPPTINILLPQAGQIFEGPLTNVSFTVNDNSPLKNVLLNEESISPISVGQYSKDINLNAGENLISIQAIDENNNTSNKSIKVTYIPNEIAEANFSGEETVSIKDLPDEKEIITLPSSFDDLASELIEQFENLFFDEGGFLDIGSTLSVEISNPPSIPKGPDAEIEIPEVPGLENIPSEENSQEVPAGFSLGTNILFQEGSEVQEFDPSSRKNENATLLVDSTGRTFIVGFAFLEEVNENASLRTNLKKKNYKFQTPEGEPLELISTITIPGDAAEGNATISILNMNASLATIPIKIVASKDVKLRKQSIAKPQIKEPIKAQITKSGTLKLTFSGRNFLKKIALVDGKLEKLFGKTNFLTKVNFIPEKGITIKSFKFANKDTIVVKAKISENIQPGAKLFNVVTPKGSDIGAIVIPDIIQAGNLEATTNPESLILNE